MDRRKAVRFLFLPLNSGHGGCSRRGAVSTGGDAPPILFLVLPKKRTRRARCKRKRRFDALRCSGPPRATGVGVRWCLRVYGDCPTGAAWCGTGLMADSRGAGAVVGRGARTHLTSFSFRAFRFATRYPGGRGGLYQRADVGIRPYGRTMAFRVPVGADVFIGPLQKPHQPPSQRQRKAAQGVSQTSPGPKSPQGQRVSVSDYRKGPPAISRRRQEGCACADRPAVAFFLFGPCTARFSFGKTKREMGGASPLDKPPAGAGIPRGRRTAAPIPSTGTVPQKFSHFVKTKPVSKFSKE